MNPKILSLITLGMAMSMDTSPYNRPSHNRVPSNGRIRKPENKIVPKGCERYYLFGEVIIARTQNKAIEKFNRAKHYGDFTYIQLCKLRDEGYSEFRMIPSKGLCGLKRFAFTTGLVYDISMEEYVGRYCYNNFSDALTAISTWNGTNDPDDSYWIKHKGLGIDKTNPKMNQHVIE